MRALSDTHLRFMRPEDELSLLNCGMDDVPWDEASGCPVLSFAAAVGHGHVRRERSGGEVTLNA